MVIFVRLKRVQSSGVLHVSSLVASPAFHHEHFISSSFTLPSTTQEHAAQPVQHDQLRKHPVHHAHLQGLPVDKQRHQESVWRDVFFVLHFSIRFFSVFPKFPDFIVFFFVVFRFCFRIIFLICPSFLHVVSDFFGVFCRLFRLLFPVCFLFFSSVFSTFFFLKKIISQMFPLVFS